MKPARLLALVLFFPLLASAQTTKLPPKKGKPSRVGIDAAKAVRLNYGLPDWNKSSTEIDSASLLMREGSTGRVVQIQLEETAPDSSIFTGLFSVQWDKISELAPEFYVPPQDVFNSAQGAKRLSEMVQKNQLKKMPFILRRSKSGQQFIELFDNLDQAKEAMKAYREEREALEMQNKKIIADSALEAARLAAEGRAREAAARVAAERARLGQVEARKAGERAAEFERLTDSEKQARRELAKKLSDEALTLYKANKFKAASVKFDEAIAADPTNRAAYFQYGVTLYRINDFNKSLVFISLADGNEVTVAEKEFYKGLNFYRLKEAPNALDSFRKVEATKHPELAPTSAFYQGMIDFEEKRFATSKDAFQRVLDTSKDPRLDDRAEEMIEQIARVQQFEAEKAKKWTLAATFGLNYDDNILQSSTSQLDTGAATNAKGWRFLQQGTLKYRPVFSPTKEFAAQLDVLNLYTVDDSFKYQTELRNTDPLLLTLSTPYTHKGTLFKKGYKLDLVPGFETIYMSIENNKNKPIVNSVFLNVLNTLVMKEQWFANYNLEMRYDDSLLDSSVGDDDSTAVKVKVGNGNYIFLDEDRSKIVTADAALTLNQAKGDNSAYNRIDLGVGYISQTFWNLTYNAKLSYFILDYSRNPSERKDNSYTALLGLSKRLNDTYSTGLTTSYNINNSTEDAYEYKRLSVLLTFSGAWTL